MEIASGVCVCGDDEKTHFSEHNFVDSGEYFFYRALGEPDYESDE